MAKRLFIWLSFVISAHGQTQIDLNRQVRNPLPYSTGGTNATNQIDARKNVGTPLLVATDFPGTDLGAKVNAAFAAFGAGNCGTVLIPAGTYTFSTQILVPTACALRGAGRGNTIGAGSNTTLIYNGPPATSAIVLMNALAGIQGDQSHFVTVEGLTLQSNANVCPGNGWLQWNPGAAGANKWQCAAYGAPVTVTAATNAAPIQITTSVAHGYSTGDRVLNSHVGGNNAANGEWAITVVDATNFTLNGSTGNAAYTSGGKSEKITYSAAVPHLAAIQHGETDPGALIDGIQITIRDIFISGQSPNGGHTGNAGQGAFHMGVYLNGCEECLIETVYVLGATDGFMVGAQTNAVTFNTITARINRRSGFHLRGQNNFVVYGGVFESNEWLFNRGTDVDKYGHGILGQDEPNQAVGGPIANGGEFDGTYFENNDCDLCSPLHVRFGINVRNSTRGVGSGSVFTDRANWFGMFIQGCSSSVDASLSLTSGHASDCPYTGAYTKDPSASTARIFAQFSGTGLKKISLIGVNPSPIDIYESAVSALGDPSYFYYRIPNPGTFRLDPFVAATVGSQDIDSTTLEMRSAKWNGAASVFKPWQMQVTTKVPFGPTDTVSSISITGPSGGAREFSFREGGVFRIPHNQVGQTPKIEVGPAEPAAGFPEDNTKPVLEFIYRSDTDITGGRIRATRGTPGNGTLFMEAQKLILQPSQSLSFPSTTFQIKPAAFQSVNQEEWYDTSGTLTSYVTPAGALAIKPSGAQPACSASTRFLFWSTPGGAGVKDSVQVCAKDATDTYAWRTIY